MVIWYILNPRTLLKLQNPGVKNVRTFWYYGVLPKSLHFERLQPKTIYVICRSRLLFFFSHLRSLCHERDDIEPPDFKITNLNHQPYRLPHCSYNPMACPHITFSSSMCCFCFFFFSGYLTYVEEKKKHVTFVTFDTWNLSKPSFRVDSFSFSKAVVTSVLPAEPGCTQVWQSFLGRLLGNFMMGIFSSWAVCSNIFLDAPPPKKVLSLTVA